MHRKIPESTVLHFKQRDSSATSAAWGLLEDQSSVLATARMMMLNIFKTDKEAQNNAS